MSAIIKLVAPNELSFLPAGKRGFSAHLKPEPIRLSPILEPEPRLWKLSARAFSPKPVLVEFCILGAFLVVALAETAGCFAELSHLLQSDALLRVVTTAIAGA